MLDFYLLQYLLSSDSKAKAKVLKLHTSFFKTKKNWLVFYLIFVKGNTSRFGSAIQVLPSDMERILWLIFYYCYCSWFLLSFLFCYGKIQFLSIVISVVGIISLLYFDNELLKYNLCIYRQIDIDRQIDIYRQTDR